MSFVSLVYHKEKKQMMITSQHDCISVQVGNNKGITGILKIPAHSMRQHDKN